MPPLSKTCLHQQVATMQISRLVLTLFCVIALMPQMISHAQQNRALNVASQGERRIALIIGNGAYAQGALANPVNDARDIAAVLRQANFEVLFGENQNQTQMKRLIRDGNVLEWCEDVWHESYVSAPSDGSAWLSGGDSSRRVLRGGSWINHGELCRAALRKWTAPGVRDDRLGFRVVAVARTQ